jgi:hypothetical protein
MTTTTQAPPLPESPYRGIESFRYIDQPLFTGRDDETWDLLSNILMYRGVLLYGDSGAGKSSLVNAGLIPAALGKNLIPNRVRVQPRLGKEIKLERIPIESDGKPPYLPSVLADESPGEREGTSGPITVELSIVDLLRRLKRLKRAPGSGERQLLIFDQFEEFVTLFEEAQRGGETEEAKRAQRQAPGVQRSILNAITRLLEDEALPVKLLFVFREDYLAKLDMLFESHPELFDQYVRLLLPRVEEAKTIIRAPFVDEQLKERFAASEGKGSREIPEHLAATIASQLQERSDGGFINLSELQIICRQLSESDDPVKFFEEKGGKIQHILEDYWAGVLYKLGDLYDPAIALLGHMVTSSNTRNIISEPDLKNHEKDNFTIKQIDDALKALIQRRLVRREPRHDVYFYEIASEFLVPWINEKKAARLAEIEARKLAAENEAKLKAAKRRERNLKLLGVGLGILIMIAAGVAFYMAELSITAKKAEAEVQVERDRLSNIIDLLKRLSSGDPQVRFEAVEELNALAANNNLPEELAPLILARFVNDGSEQQGSGGSTDVNNAETTAVFKAASALLPIAAQKAGKDLGESIINKAAESNTALVNKLRPRVYIHLSDKSQLSRANKIAEALRDKDYSVPPYEDVSDRKISRNQLQHHEPSDSTEVGKIVSIIEGADGQDWSPFALPASSKVRPGHFEIWFANAAAPTAQTGNLTLKFVDDKGTEIPMSMLTVMLIKALGEEGTTLTSNTVSLPARTYQVMVGSKDRRYSNSIMPLTVEKGQTREVKIVLRPAGLTPEQQQKPKS